MKRSDIPTIRLSCQQISGTKFKKAKDLVDWMGAMQAQDYAMAKWAVGVRMPGSSEAVIESAIDKGEIIRTHVLRPTWHLVPAKDVSWMLELTAPHIKSSMKSQLKHLELTPAVFNKSNALLEKVLHGGKQLVREELVKEFTKAKIPVDHFRAAHLLLNAELDGIICSGARKGNKTTYALLEERVPKRKTLQREEALAKLGEKYFRSHFPATTEDFRWWSGLPAADARRSIELNAPDLKSETIQSQTYWLPRSFTFSGANTRAVHLLPAFDEFIISYKNRSASLHSDHHKKTVTVNGIFRPVIVVNGRITGLWRRTNKKEKVILETEFFRPHGKAELSQIRKASDAFGDFLGKKTEIRLA